VVHFTEGATDQPREFRERGARFVSLVEGGGDIDVTCLHLSPGGKISDPPVTHDRAVLILHGKVIVWWGPRTSWRLDLSPGVGFIVKAHEPYAIECPNGAIVLTIEAQRLEATLAGISTPARIADQRWPGES
jgi:hypothetical protein